MIKEIKGFVVKPPVSKAACWGMSYQTFGLTTMEAWVRHCKTTYDNPDISRKIQAWHDRGYRIREATLCLYTTEEDEPSYKKE